MTWKFIEDEEAEVRCSVKDESGRNVITASCCCCGLGVVFANESDKALTLAAPDLLAALKDILDGYGYCDFISEEERNSDLAVIAAKAAIAKAEGK